MLELRAEGSATNPDKPDATILAEHFQSAMQILHTELATKSDSVVAKKYT